MYEFDNMTIRTALDRAALDYWNAYQLVSNGNATWRELGYTVNDNGELPAALVDVINLISIAKARAYDEIKPKR